MKKYTYITLLTDDSYVYGVILLHESLKQVKTKYPLLVLITEDVSEPVKEMLNQYNITFNLINNIPIPQNIYEYNLSINKRLATTWKDTWAKFKIFDLIQYDKIIFLDTDILILKNLDHLFNKPHLTAAVDGEYFNLYPNNIFFNSGLMVVIPNHTEYKNILNFANNITEYPKDKKILADQEILNLYYSKWSEQKELHLNKYYNIFAPYTQDEDIENLEKNCYFIHFIGRKPWVTWIPNPEEHYSEYYYIKAKEIIERSIKTIDIKKVIEKVKLTVYGICKNEINNIEKFLNSFIEADYVCLLDTGSTDGTWELLQEKQKEYPNLIIAQKEITPWRYDIARNESMKLIPKETVLFFMADLDEIIKEKNWSKIVKNSWQPTFNRGMYNYNRDVDEQGNVLRAFKEFRIHSKVWTHWKNIVHEALINKFGEKQFYTETCTPINITVWHFPDKTKSKNYIQLCEDNLKESPDDYIMRLQLAIEYEIANKWDNAFLHYAWLISNFTTLSSFELARCYSGIGKYYYNQNNLIKSLSYFREGRLICPNFADNYLDAAQIFYNKKNYIAAKELCEAALLYCNESVWCSVHDIHSFLIYHILGLCYYYLNNIDKCIKYLDIAIYYSNDDEIKQQHNKILCEYINKIKK